MMMDVTAAYKLVEGLPPGSWAAVSLADGSILASRPELDDLFTDVDQLIMNEEPLILKVPDGLQYL